MYHSLVKKYVDVNWYGSIGYLGLSEFVSITGENPVIGKLYWLHIYASTVLIIPAKLSESGDVFIYTYTENLRYSGVLDFIFSLSVTRRSEESQLTDEQRKTIPLAIKETLARIAGNTPCNSCYKSKHGICKLGDNCSGFILNMEKGK